MRELKTISPFAISSAPKSPVLALWEEWLTEIAADRRVSDILLSDSGRSHICRDGQFLGVKGHDILSHDDFWLFVQAHLNVSPADFLSGMEVVERAFRIGKIRLRASLAKNINGVDLTMRRVNESVPDVESLKSPHDAVEYARSVRDGIILFTGQTGSGKTTAMMSMMVERGNTIPGERFITIEDPVEYEVAEVLPSGSLFTQREVGFSVKTFAAGLGAAMRQRPKVIIIGEIRDAATLSEAVALALSGHVVAATFHAADAVSAFRRMSAMLHSEPGGAASLATAVKMIMTQRLVPSKKGDRVVPLHEVYLQGPQIMPALLANNYEMVEPYIANFQSSGMITFDESRKQRGYEGLL